MGSARVIAGMVAGALCVAGVVVAPGLAASPSTRQVRQTPAPRSLAGGFTPAAADPRLAAVFARGGLAGDFHFTPADTRRDGRGVMVAVRVRGNRPAAPERLAAATPAAPGLVPIAYNAGAALGWKRFAVTGDLARVDLGPLPGSREAADVSVSYQAKRFTGRLRAAADRPYGEVAQLVDQPQSYSVDVGGAYKLTRNLDVTAGVRYRSDRDRLTHVTDDTRRDSQAAYVGTIFRF